jgi:hypothetical protein
MMVRRSFKRANALTFTSVLLAGASIPVLSAAAGAAPLPPYWVVSSVLADAPAVSQPDPVAGISLYRPAPKPRADIGAYLRPSYDSTPLTLNSIEFKPQPDAAGFLQMNVATGTAHLAGSVGARVARLGDHLDFADGTLSAQVTSIDASLMGGNLRFSSDVIDTGAFEDRRDFRDPQLRETSRDIRDRDLTRRHRFAAKVIDSGNLKLMVDGEIGQVSDQFALNFGALRSGDAVLPGSWTNMSSRLEYGRTNLSVGYQDFETRNEANKRQQFVVGVGKSELEVFRRQGMEFNLINGGQWLKRTSYQGVNADIMLADVMPSTVADFVDPVSFILPTSVRAGFERGDVQRAEFTTGPRDKVSTANLAMTWNTRLGDTTASYWERRIATDLYTPGAEDGVKLSSSRDRYVDVSHSIRHGNWKLGAGLSLIQTNDELLGQKSSGSEYAPHVSVAYEPEHGPKVELRFGAADAQSQIVDDNLAARAKTKQIQLSLDVSDYVRDELNSPNAKLKLEYRYDLSDSGDSSPANRSEGGHALLVTFSTPLN